MVDEEPAGEELGLAPEAFRSHPAWRTDFPWLLQGITTAAPGGPEDEPLNLRLFGPEAASRALERWEGLRVAAGMARLAVARQVHGARVRVHGDPEPGLLVVDGTDAHVSREPGLLLAVTVADCVPVHVVDPETRVVGLAHAGWRGIAAGVVEELLATLTDRFASEPGALRAHLGPAACGRCYEVGPEVHRALGRQEPPEPEPVDLRGEAARRLLEGGVVPDRITTSALCTLCGEVPFHSHRGGAMGRQAALLGIRWTGKR